MKNIIELFRRELLEVALFKDKTVSMKSYGTYLKVIDVDGAERLPFRDILKI